MRDSYARNECNPVISTYGLSLYQFSRKWFRTYSALGLLCLITCGLLPSPAIYGQTTTGAVQGSVADSTGAVIPGVEVTVQNVDTGISTVATSNNVGIYSLRFLPVGRYTIVARGRAFGTEVDPAFRNIDLSAYKSFRITESQRLEFHADAFNALNFANLGTPNTTVTNSGSPNVDFGQITSTNGNQRIVQRALNYHL